MKRAQQEAAILTEIDRLKDRLDLMERQLSGDTDAWWRITTNLPETVAEVIVDKVLAEARQTAVALASLVKTLASLAAEETPANPQADPADEIKAARERKLAEAKARAAQA